MEILFCVVFVLLGSYVSAEDDRYIIYQEGNTTRVIDLQGKIDPIVLKRASTRDNDYLLFTQKNPDISQQLYTNDANSISSSNFNRDVPTVVIVHGWEGSRLSGINPTITKAYLTKSDVNIIVVDWSWLALRNYVTAVFGTPAAGRSLGRFLNYLNSQAGAEFNNMHLIGFSLGAHLVGNAGRSLNTKVARITGLDPAGPLWTLNPAHLMKTDAVYVEAIHTDRNLFGTNLNVGHTDFSPNGGFKQPGCSVDVCSHNRAWEYFAATVTYNNLIGYGCGTDVSLLLNMCFGSSLHMGNDDLRKNGTGIYRVKTTSSYPYST